MSTETPTTQVWIVETGVEYEDCANLIGAFSSEELAQAAVEHHKLEQGREWVESLNDSNEWEKGGARITYYPVDVETQPRPEWEQHMKPGDQAAWDDPGARVIHIVAEAAEGQVTFRCGQSHPLSDVRPTKENDWPLHARCENPEVEGP